MRQLGQAAVVLAAFSIAVGLPPAKAKDAPTRKPGLWEITTIGAGTGTNTARTCIAAEDKILTPSGGGDCSAPAVSSGGEDTTIVTVICKDGDAKETISGAFTGSFDSRYRAQVKISFDPPQTGMPPNWGVTIDAKYLGPDCAGATP